MPDKPTPQPKPTDPQAAQPVEGTLDTVQQPSKSIRSNLMSGQVESAPIVSEANFAQPGAQKPAAADAKPVKPTHLKGRHSKLIGLLSVMGLLLLASVALFFTYRSYQASYQKVQKSRVSNSIAPTTVDLGGLAPTSSTLQGIGLLQVNGDAIITNNVTANSFSGSGADLSNVNATRLNSQPGSFYQNATNIDAGTLGDQFLSPNVALLNANQAFTGSNTFGGSSNFTGAVVLPGTLTINSLTYNMPGSQAAGTLSNDGAGNLIWQAAGACPTCVNTGGNSFGAAMSVGTNDPFNLSFRTNGITRLTFDTAGNATFTGAIVGNGSGITNLNGSNISSGTVADARLTSNVTLQGNLFNGAFELVQLGAAGQLPALNGAALTNLDASNISAGTLSDSRLSANVTLQGNTFNAANKLVQLNGTGGLPALNGSLLTALNASNISSGTVADARLSTNVALLNANQTFSGTNAFSAGITTNTIATTTGLTVGTTSQSLALQGNGSTTLASNSGGFVTTVGFSGVPAGNVNYNFDAATAAGTYGICTTVGNCASAGGAVTTLGGTTNKVAKFTGLQSIGDGSITDTGTQVTTQSTSTDSASAFRVLNAAGTTTAFNVDTTNTRIGVGTATPSYAVDAVGDINSSTGLRVAGTQVCDNTGCIAAASSGFYINNGTGTQATANFNIQSAAAGNIGGVIKGAAAQTANLQEWQNSAGTTLASVSAAGTINTAGQYQVAGVQIASSDLSNNANLAKLDATQSFTGINTFQNTANSTGAFKIQNAAGSSNLLIADTTNTRIGIGTASPGYTLDVNGDVNISTGSLYRINGVAICGATGTCAPSALSTFYIQNGTGQQASANFNIVSTAIGSITGILQGAVGQTAELLQLRAGDGTIVAGFSNVGVLTLGNDNGTPQAGSIVIHDNTGSNTFTSTIGTAALTASRTITFPNETGTVCTTGSVCTGYAPGTGGAYANQQLSNLSGTVAINLSLTPNADNTLDLGSSAASWRTLYADTSLLTPLLDTATGVALNLGTSTATSVSLGRTGITTTNNGALTVTQLLTGNLGATIGGGAIALTGTAASSFTTSAGTLTLGTSSTADLILRTNSGSAGQLTLSGASGAGVTYLTGTGATYLASTGALNLTSGANATTTLTSSGATTIASAAAYGINILAGVQGAVTITAGYDYGFGGGAVTITGGAGAAFSGGAVTINPGFYLTNSANLNLGDTMIGSGALTIGGSNQTGGITIGNSSGAQLIRIGTVGGNTGAAQTVINSGTGGTQIQAGSFGLGGDVTLNALGTGAIRFRNASAERFNIANGSATLTGQGATTFNAANSTLGSVGFAMNITGSAGSTSATPNTVGSVGGLIQITSGAGGAGSAANAGGGLGGALTLAAGAGGSSTGIATAGAGGVLSLSGGAGGGNWFAGSGGAVNISGGASHSSSIFADVGTGGAVSIIGGAGANANGGFSVSSAGGAGGALTLSSGTGGNGNNGGSGTVAGGAGGTLNIIAGGGGGGSGVGSVNGAGGAVNITAGNGFGGGNITLTAGSVGGLAGVFGGYIVMKTYSTTNYGLDLDASVITSGTGMRVLASGTTTGTGLSIVTGTTLTGAGNALLVTTTSTAAPTNGIVRFNFNGNRTTAGNAFQIDDISTSLATTMKINSNSLTTGTAMAISATAITSGIGLSITTGTALTTTGNALLVSSPTVDATTTGIVRFNFSGIRTGATSTGFQIDDAATTTATTMKINSNSLTTGTAMAISATALTSGTGLSITTGAALTGAGNALLVTTTSTAAPTNGIVRFNLNGIRTTAGVGFQIDDISTTAATTMKINSNSLTTGTAMAISANAITTGTGLAITTTTDSVTASNLLVLQGGSNSIAEAGTHIQFKRPDGTVIGSIAQNAATTVAYNTSSDARLKENIVDTAFGLDSVLAIKVRDYTFISDPTQTVTNGFVAQELYNIYPGAVTVGSDAVDADGRLTNPWAIDYGKLTPLLAKGIQELNTKVDASAAGLSASVLQTLATANAITINGTLTINGVTIFNGNAKFNGDITVNQDGAGEATIVAGASSVDVLFSKELAAIPVVTASPQDFIDGQYKITSITKAGFTISTSISQTADAKFSWTAVQK